MKRNFAICIAIVLAIYATTMAIWPSSARASDVWINAPSPVVDGGTWERVSPGYWWHVELTAYTYQIGGIPPGRTVETLYWKTGDSHIMHTIVWPEYTLQPTSKTVQTQDIAAVYYQWLENQLPAEAAACWAAGHWEIQYDDNSLETPAIGPPSQEGDGIFSITPSPAAPGQEAVTITGHGFGQTGAMSFTNQTTGAHPTQFTPVSWSDTQITFSLQDTFPTGSYTITVVTADQAQYTVRLDVLDQEQGFFSGIWSTLRDLPTNIRNTITDLFIPTTDWGTQFQDDIAMVGSQFPFNLIVMLENIRDAAGDIGTANPTQPVEPEAFSFSMPGQQQVFTLHSPFTPEQTQMVSTFLTAAIYFMFAAYCIMKVSSIAKT